MPRRNRRQRQRKARLVIVPTHNLPATYEAMARDLVKRGLAPAEILTHPIS